MERSKDPRAEVGYWIATGLLLSMGLSVMAFGGAVGFLALGLTLVVFRRRVGRRAMLLALVAGILAFIAVYLATSSTLVTRTALPGGGQETTGGPATSLPGIGIVPQQVGGVVSAVAAFAVGWIVWLEVAALERPGRSGRMDPLLWGLAGALVAFSFIGTFSFGAITWPFALVLVAHLARRRADAVDRSPRGMFWLGAGLLLLPFGIVALFPYCASSSVRCGPQGRCVQRCLDYDSAARLGVGVLAVSSASLAFGSGQVVRSRRRRPAPAGTFSM